MPRSDVDNAAALLFPSIDKPQLLFELYVFLQDQTLTCIKSEFFIAILGLIITTFHLVVLTRKSILTSSVISIMTGIAICDWVSMAIVVGIKDISVNFYRDEWMKYLVVPIKTVATVAMVKADLLTILGKYLLFASTPPSSYFTLRILYVLLSIRDAVIRCSTWLSVLMALKRLVSLKSTMSLPPSKSVSSGFYAFGGCFVTSSLMSMLSYLRTKTVEIGSWTPGKDCDIKIEETFFLHDQQSSGFFSDFWLRIFNFANGFSSRIIPCILLPILTVLLVLKIQKLRKTTSASNSVVWRRTERTTYLVILMSVTFLIANLPSGVFTFIQVIYTDIGFLGLSVFVDRFCNAISTINASVHCVICFTMSTDYRKAVKEIAKVQQSRQISVSKF